MSSSYVERFFRSVSVACSIVVVVLSSSPLSAQTRSPEEVRIGVIAGLTGEYASVFTNFIRGITLAREEFSEHSFPIVTAVEDDKFDAKSGLLAYHRLSAQGRLNALINGTSPTIGAIAPLLKKASLPTIQLGEEAEQPAVDNIFQIMPGNISVEIALGAEAQKTCPKNFVLFVTNSPTLNRFAEAFEIGFRESLTKIMLPQSPSDIFNIVSGLANKEPRCVGILAFPPAGAAVVKALRQSITPFPNIYFDPSFQTGNKEYLDLLGDLRFLDNAVVATLNNTTAPWFLEKYKDRYHEAPGFAADLGYDAIYVLVRTFDPVRSTWINNIKQANLQGASGTIRFDATGVRTASFTIALARALREEHDK